MSLKNSPKITVVTVTYNCASVLQATIDSVAGQTHPNLEYIVVDGASTDGTVDVIKANADRITRWVSEPDGGIYDAMNKGIAMATGEWINFMNAGDIFHAPDTTELLFAELREDIEILYGDTQMMLHVGSYRRRCPELGQMEKRMMLGHQATFVRRCLLEEMPFDRSFKIAADYNFFYQAYKQQRLFQHVDLVVADYECEEGLSTIQHLKSRKENARIHGIEGQWSWRIKFTLLSSVYRTKSLLKRILPQGLVRKIRQQNMVRNSR